MKIAHFADVHFRGLARHNEYRESFEDAFRQLRDIKPDLIYIGGDIVHSKTQGITPELIDVLSWWFESLAEIAPVDVLLGNHDGLIMNQNRQDAISPVISALANPKIRLLKKSGCYDAVIPGFNLCVFSLFDRAEWKTAKPKPGCINIALYHGSVKGAVSDSDFELEGEIGLGFFENFDFALLGDIHKRQFLNAQRTIAYCGSTIQQNYAEEQTKGFLLWEIKNRNDFDVTFFPVKNSHPFITVSLADNFDSDYLLSKIMSGSRVRLDISTKDMQRVKEFCARVERDLSPLEITYKTHADSIGQITHQQETIASIDVKKSLIEFIGRKDLPGDTKDETLKKLEFYLNSRDGADDLIRNVKWDLNKIEFDNLFAYGENNTVDFDALPGITGIFGKNRSGKSSIIGAIVYALFNTTDRGSMKNLHVINSKKESCRAKTSLTVSSDQYEVVRETVKNYPKKSEVWASTTLSVSKSDSQKEEQIDLNDEQRRETEKVLRKIIGTADDFFYTCLSPQGYMNLFINEKSTARKQMLTRFLDIDYFEELGNRVKSDIAPYKSKLKIFGSEVECKSQIEKSESRIKEIESEKESYTIRLNEVKDLISSLSNSIPQDLIRNKRDLARATEEKLRLESEIKMINEEIDQENSKHATIVSKLTRAQDVLSEINFQEMEKSAHDQRDMARQIELEEKDLKLKNREKDTLLKSVELLGQVPCKGQYPACQFICDSHKNKERLPGVESQISVKERSIEILKNRSRSLDSENPISALEKAQKIKEAKKELELNSSKLESKIEILKERLSGKVQSLEKVSRTISDLEESLSGKEIGDESSKIEALEITLKDLEVKIIDSATEIGVQREKSRNLAERISEISSSQAALRVLEVLESAFSKKGVPQEIISSALPKINSEIAEILDGIAGFTVEIECDDSNSVEVYLNYGDNRRLIELGSGMEKMIASIAIRVALTNISSLPKSSMFIIDEGFGALDDNNLEACARLLTNLKSYFKNILIISHVDAIKDIVDNVIDIGWEDGFAKVAC